MYRCTSCPALCAHQYPACFAGVGIQFGGMAKLGGRVVDAPLVESPAESAGIRKGDRVLEIGKPTDQLTHKQSRVAGVCDDTAHSA